MSFEDINLVQQFVKMDNTCCRYEVCPSMDKDGRDPTRDTEEVDLPGQKELMNEKLINWGDFFFFKKDNSNHASLEMRTIMSLYLCNDFPPYFEEAMWKPPPLQTNFHLTTI